MSKLNYFTSHVRSERSLYLSSVRKAYVTSPFILCNPFVLISELIYTHIPCCHGHKREYTYSNCTRDTRYTCKAI